MLALLVYLAVEAPNMHRRDALASLLWPDQPRENARHSLRQALTTLRRVLKEPSGGASFVVSEGDSVGFRAGGDARTDIAEFTGLLDACAAHAHRQLETCVPCAHRQEQAIRLYQGELCAGASFGDSEELESWLHVHRERLHRRAMGAFTTLVAHHEANGRLDEARRIVERQLELDPWRESAHRALMRLLYHLNERAAALQQYEKCVQLLEEELGLEPEPETVELYEQIRAGPAAGPGAAIAARKAAPDEPLTPLIGRDEDIARIADLVTQAECRLLTLTGPGGIGKTRLALRVAAEVNESFAQGACVVALAPVRSVDLLAPTIAEALGASHQGRGDPIHHLVNLLRERQKLLVLDSMEHLLDGSAMIAGLLARAPELRILATSRERLGLQAEWVYPVGGLAVPADDADAPEEAASVRLFLEGLRRVRPHIPVRDDERPTIGAICRLVEGMPLAIELAAAWASTLTIPDIEREIEQSIDFLEIPLRDVPARHRSMRAVFDQSWELLAPEEQSVFQRLSMFRGGFSREAAEYVAGSTLPLLSALVNKSFLRPEPHGRYSVHDLLRQYAERQLAHHQREELRARDRYSRYFLSYIADREAALTGRDQKEALAEITAEIANIRHAWRIAIDMQMKEPINHAVHGLWLFYVLRGWMREGEAAFGDVVTAFSPAGDDGQHGLRIDPLLAKALTRQGGFASGLGNYGPAAERIRQGIAMLRALDDRREVALGLNFLAAANHMLGNETEEESLLAESLTLFRQVEDPWGEAYVLSDIAMLAHAHGDAEQADAFSQESRRLLRQINDVRGLAFAAQYLGMLALDRGDRDAARRFHEEALALRRESEDQWGIATSLAHLGETLRAEGDLDGARKMLLDALRVAREVDQDL